MEVIPFGYGAFIAEPDGGLAHLDVLMVDPRRVIVDIRLVTYSSAKFPMWHKGSLAERYGHNAQGKARYIHGSALGNLNYKPEDRDKGFDLKAKRTGLDKLKSFLDAGYQPILLCGCRDYTYCHRAYVVQMLKAEVPGLIVTQTWGAMWSNIIDPMISSMSQFMPECLLPRVTGK